MSAVLPGAAMPGSDSRSPSVADPLRPIAHVPLPNAAERLAASRVRLRAALMEIAHPPPRPSMFDGLGKIGSIRDLAGPWLDKLKDLPVASFVLETVEAWWAQHPLRTASIVAGEASREFVLPIARQNPGALVLGSVLLGVLLIVSRPWRWLLRPALFIGLVPQLASQALKRMPIETWIGMFESFKSKRRTPGSAAAGTPRASSGQDPSMP